MKISMVALGCSKNVVSAEQMLHRLDAAGHELVSDPSEADVAVVNTCGFIDSAKRESIEQILELCALGTKVVVSGCLAERYRDDILAEMPEVAGLVGCGSFDDIAEAVEAAAAGQQVNLFGALESADLDAPRVLTSPAHTAYIKVAEGCDNRCSYCVIPSLRGQFRSRTEESVAAEAEALVLDGAKELILIAQDTSRYGLDLYGALHLPSLLRRLCAIEGLHWLRLMYLYPEHVTDELIGVIAAEPKIVKYLDIPIQHCEDRILAAMNRRGTKAELTALFARLRGRIPGVVLRTSVIVGFPGETEAEFEALCAFLRGAAMERAGVFPYSQEEGTPAAALAGQVDEATKLSRADIVQSLQRDIMDRYNASLKGKTLDVLVEGYDRYVKRYFGRSAADAPDVDNMVFFTSGAPIPAGELAAVTVTGAMDGNLLGRAPA